MDHKKFKLLVIFGTRPEAIKLAPVILELRKYEQLIVHKVCVTAQHREMLDETLKFFDIHPDIDLDLMQPDQSLETLTTNTVLSVSQLLEEESPDLVLVQGDTTTAMATALACFYKKNELGHVEAGLRTGDLSLPYPEELNRRIISLAATYHFAPTQRAVEALLHEGISQDKVIKTGNTVIDTLKLTLSKPCEFNEPFIQTGRKIILVTAHRRESFGQPFRNMCEAFKLLINRNKEIEIVYPVHLNPNIKKTAYLLLSEIERIHLIPPLKYHRFVHLMQKSYLILTDSGGIQEEAPVIGKPVLIVRDKTERKEVVESGVAKLIGTQVDTIVSHVEKLLYNTEIYNQMVRQVSLYGDGKAAEKIMKKILDIVKLNNKFL